MKDLSETNLVVTYLVGILWGQTNQTRTINNQEKLSVC